MTDTPIYGKPLTLLVLGVDVPAGAAVSIAHAHAAADLMAAMGYYEPRAEPIPRDAARGSGRNQRCSCGSGRKFKVCCMRKASDAAP